MKTITLGEGALTTSGSTPARGKKEFWQPAEIPWVKTSEVNYAPIIETEESISKTALKKCSLTLLPPNTILVAMYGQGKTRGQAAILKISATINQACFAILPNEIWNPEFLFFWFKASYNKLRELSEYRGGNQANLNSRLLKSLNIPAPDKKNQYKIAARLKARLSEIEKSINALEIQLQETEKLANAIIFNSINCGKPQTLPLGKVLDEIKQGIGENWADFPVLGATKDGLAPAKSPPGKKPERYKPVFPGTVFYNPMRILIGSIAFVDEDDTPGITSPDYVVLKGKPGVVDSRWFYYWLRSPLGEHCILSLARGAVRERMLFSRLSKGNIELPDFKIQQDAAAALAELKPLRRTLERQRDEITQMPQKILAQAFEIEP